MCAMTDSRSAAASSDGGGERDVGWERQQLGSHTALFCIFWGCINLFNVFFFGASPTDRARGIY